MTIVPATGLPLHVDARVHGDRLELAIELRNETSTPVHPLVLDPTGNEPWWRLHDGGDDRVVVGAGRFRAAPWAPATAMPAWPSARALAAGQGVRLQLTRRVPLVEDGLTLWGEHDPSHWPVVERSRIVVVIECVLTVRGRPVRLPGGAELVAGAAKRVALAIGETSLASPIAMRRTPMLLTPLGDPPHAVMDGWLPERLRRHSC